MSYDIYLRDRVTKETVHFDTPHQMAGGTYAVGGTPEAWLNITYNYARWYYKDGVFPDRGEAGKDFHKMTNFDGTTINRKSRHEQSSHNVNVGIFEKERD